MGHKIGFHQIAVKEIDNIIAAAIIRFYINEGEGDADVGVGRPGDRVDAVSVIWVAIQ